MNVTDIFIFLIDNGAYCKNAIIDTVNIQNQFYIPIDNVATDYLVLFLNNYLQQNKFTMVLNFITV